MKQPLTISLSPNTQVKDVLKSLQLLLSPWGYFREEGIKKLEQWFRVFFHRNHAIAFNSGRSACYAILHNLAIGNGDEVMLQAFTCVAVPNAILAAGAKPLYIDITSDYTLDPADITKKITKRTKAIIVQHTFGIPADMDAIMEIAKKHNLFIIEDVAHTIGGAYKGKKLGQFGIASFFSFGRDKAFSSVSGGMAITNDKELGKKLRLYQKKKSKPSFWWVMQQLIHPVAFVFILPFYDFASLGKVILVILQRIHILSIPITQKEKKGIFSPRKIRKFSNQLAYLALLQLSRLSEINQKRRNIAKRYYEACTNISIVCSQPRDIAFLRYPVQLGAQEKMKKYFRKHGVYVGDWYTQVVDPKEVVLEDVLYKKGSCVAAEKACEEVINLPTNVSLTEKDVTHIITLLNVYARNKTN